VKACTCEDYKHGVPVKAHRFPNGAMMVFDAEGHQVPCYQGFDLKDFEALQADYPEVAAGITSAVLKRGDS
jgi:hypothetical protein